MSSNLTFKATKFCFPAFSIAFHISFQMDKQTQELAAPSLFLVDIYQMIPTCGLVCAVRRWILASQIRGKEDMEEWGGIPDP